MNYLYTEASVKVTREHYITTFGTMWFPTGKQAGYQAGFEGFPHLHQCHKNLATEAQTRTSIVRSANSLHSVHTKKYISFQ